MTSGSWYDVMQVCLNGHQITTILISNPQGGRKHCSKCGAATISKCLNCEANIPGYYHVPNVFAFAEDKPPAFCHNCGKPYPWTEARLKGAQEYADEIEGLSESEKQSLKSSLDDLVSDSPLTELAATRFKRLVGKAGKSVADGFRSILADVVSETVRKMIWPN
jgi:hypothetical protein